MTSVIDRPDCGSAQTNCGNTQGAELADEELDNLIRYVALLGVRGRRDLGSADTKRRSPLRGERV